MKAQDALALFTESEGEDEPPGLEQVQKYVQDDLDRLLQLLEGKVSSRHVNNLRRHVHFGEEVDYRDILMTDLPGLEQEVESYALAQRERELEREARQDRQIGFENLLHPIVERAGWEQFLDGHLRDAVLNSFIAVFDQIRERTGLALDGAQLATHALSANDPYLVLNSLDDESGQNDQVGFMKIFEGAYRGIRNPKAHSLRHDLRICPREFEPV